LTSSTLKKIIFCLVLFGIILAVYSPGINGPFVFDDITSITTNAALRLTNLSINDLNAAAFSGEAGPLKRPVAMTSFALNYYFAGGYIASAFKITNIVIHCINALLVFALSLQLFKRIAITTCKTHYPLNTFWLAASISLLWALLPAAVCFGHYTPLT